LHGFRWRFGIGWWLVLLFGLPMIALLLGLTFGGLLQTVDLGLVLIKQLSSIVLAVVVINLWEETVWAGFLQTRLRPASTSSWPPRGATQLLQGSGQDRSRHGNAGVGRLSKWRPRDSRLKRSAPC
jgi:membrane protease YdiL (CAAX protease family)